MKNPDSLQPLLSGGVAGIYSLEDAMTERDRWRQRVELALSRAGVRVVELPTGQWRIEGKHFSMTIGDLAHLNPEQLETLCG